MDEQDLTVEAQMEKGGDLVVTATISDVTLTLRSPQPVNERADIIETLVSNFEYALAEVLLAALDQVEGTEEP